MRRKQIPIGQATLKQLTWLMQEWEEDDITTIVAICIAIIHDREVSTRLHSLVDKIEEISEKLNVNTPRQSQTSTQTHCLYTVGEYDDWHPGCKPAILYDFLHLPDGDFCPHCGKPKLAPLPPATP